MKNKSNGLQLRHLTYWQGNWWATELLIMTELLRFHSITKNTQFNLTVNERPPRNDEYIDHGDQLEKCGKLLKTFNPFV
jgi:hypothetical protein